MVQLELDNSERDLVARLLEYALGEMRVEVRRTRTPDFHDSLRADEDVLKGVLTKLKAPA